MKTLNAAGVGHNQFNNIDAKVGAHIRLYRVLKGMSQQHLANLLGLTFQQIQKYEQGDNRIGAGRLYRIAQILNVPVSVLFDDLATRDCEFGNSDIQTIQRRETFELVKSYNLISDAGVRGAVLELIRSFETVGSHESMRT